MAQPLWLHVILSLCSCFTISKRSSKSAGNTLKQHITQSIRRNSSTPATSPRSERINPSIPVEEETLPGYNAEHYYPVNIGQVFDDRYRTIGKLGYGSASTVWLCRDIRKPNEYTALKVYVNCSKVHRELPIYEHINSLHSEHQGRDHVRKLLDAFKIKGPHGTHICLVHEPLGLSLDEIRAGSPDGILSAALIREMFRWILRGLEFLHKEAHVIHTGGSEYQSAAFVSTKLEQDLQPNNLLMGVQDNSIFARFELYEAENPCPRKELADRTIYLSRPVPFSSGAPALSDLSEARFGELKHTEDIMPDVYRAPEVVLGISWGYPVDIWSLGMVIWELFEGTRLFPARNADGYYSERHHLAQMVAILGPPPLGFLRKSEKSRRFWDEDGTWIGEAPIPNTSLETAEQRLEGEEKKTFLALMRKMLQWEPEHRGNCRDIFFDEWLLADLIEAGIVTSSPEP
ncbi:MAG: hypothetical protein M1821_003954 [Bathelium mastoideum]|nr:MAG: hypothetical protein M1821_003954 [Bathelium mastoideum]KAI9691028.1 MAG: hypothetical protein M1822_008648 [Bathelium mastoideum]